MPGVTSYLIAMIPQPRHPLELSQGDAPADGSSRHHAMTGHACQIDLVTYVEITVDPKAGVQILDGDLGSTSRVSSDCRASANSTCA